MNLVALALWHAASLAWMDACGLGPVAAAWRGSVQLYAAALLAAEREIHEEAP